MNTRKQTIPMQTRRAQFMPETVNAEQRTVTLVWTTGAAVRRYDWWEDRVFYEELSLDEGHVHMDRLNNGAPLLNNHAQRDLSDVIGVVERAWIENGKGHADVRFSERAEVDGIFKDVSTGVIRNVSVGYMVAKYEMVSETDGIRTLRAVDWTPAEISLVAVPADAGAGIRSLPESVCEFINHERAESPKEPEMANANPAAQPAPENPTAPVEINTDQLRSQAIAEERTRVSEITKLCARHGLQDLGTSLIDQGDTVEQARAKILDELATRDAAAPTLPRTEIMRDEVETRRAGMEEFILYRVNHGQLNDNSKQYVGLSLVELARKSLEAAGHRTSGMSREQVAARAMHTTSDFPEILANVANKTLRAAYEAAPRSFTAWCRRNTTPDFKEMARTQLGDSPNLEKVNEAGEFTYGTVGEAAEKYALSTFGRIVAVTRRAIVNDDLSAFSRIIPGFGAAAAALENETIYGILNINPAMADGTDLFHADHGNLAGTNAAISVASLGAARALMRKQTGINGRKIRVTPRYLIVPAALETVAQQYTSNAHVPDPSSNINPFASALEVIVDPTLDDGSATAWYLAADPNQIDTIEYSYLEGNEGVYIETRNGFEVDGVEIKARLDFAAKAIDWRGMVKNAGA